MMNAMVFHAPAPSSQLLSLHRARPHLPSFSRGNSQSDLDYSSGSSTRCGINSPSLDYQDYQQFAGPRFHGLERAAPPPAPTVSASTALAQYPQSLSSPRSPASSFSKLPLTSEAIAALTATYLRGPLRRGKWTLAEVEYMAAMILYFCAGVIGIPYGTTLRSHLATQLHCDPMRISKKLLPGTIVAGFKMMPKLGRRCYYPRLAQDANETAEIEQQQIAGTHHLEALRGAFLASLETLREEEAQYERLEAQYRHTYGRRTAAASGSRGSTRTRTVSELSPTRRKRSRSTEAETTHWDPRRTSSSVPISREVAAPHSPIPMASQIPKPQTPNGSTRTPTALPSLRQSLQRASAIMAHDREGC